MVKGLWGMWSLNLELVREQAENNGDRPTQAWALHQLGTMAIPLNASQAAQTLLQALKMRLSLGDEAGEAYTLHNLNILLFGGGGIDGEPKPDPTPEPPVIIEEPVVDPIPEPIVIVEEQVVDPIPRPSTWSKIASFFTTYPWVILAAILGALTSPSLPGPPCPWLPRPIQGPSTPSARRFRYTYTVRNASLPRLPGPITIKDDMRSIVCPALKRSGIRMPFWIGTNYSNARPAT